MKTKIRVHGKSQSRTALGIINAYLKLHPYATPYEMQQAFPKSLNRRCSAENLIIPIEEILGHIKMFFEQENEMIVFKTGKRYAFVEVWEKDDFNAICKHAKQYGIEVAKEKTKPFEKGSFELEYFDEGRKKYRFGYWGWTLLLVLWLFLLILCWQKCNCSEKYISPIAAVAEQEEKQVTMLFQIPLMQHSQAHSNDHFFLALGRKTTVPLISEHSTTVSFKNEFFYKFSLYTGVFLD